MAQRLVSFGKFSDGFVIGKKLGEGAFATVFKATVVGGGGAASGEGGLPPPPTEFAVKRITREGLKEGDKQSVYDEVRCVMLFFFFVLLVFRTYTDLLSPLHHEAV